MTDWNRCSVDGCSKKAKTKGAKFCSACFERQRLYGRTSYITSRHGYYDTPYYAIWSDMKQRCNSPTHHAYHLYGGRGITVCDFWQQDFTNFLFSMGFRPSDKHTLERVDNDLGYSPDNCVWATWKAQNRNRSSTKLNEEAVKVMQYLYKAGQKTQAALARAYKIDASLVSLVCSGHRWRETQ